MTIIAGARIDGVEALDPPWKGAKPEGVVAVWRRPTWADRTEAAGATGIGYHEDYDHIREVAVGRATVWATSTDRVVAEGSASAECVVQRWSPEIEIGDFEATSAERYWGPFSVNQARTLTEADLPGAKPGFAELALEAVGKLLAAIDASRDLPEPRKVAEGIATVCPDGLDWCTDHHWAGDTWPSEGETNYHEAMMGTTGIRVSRDDYEGIGPVRIIPAVLPIDNMMCDASYARQLAADLITAAEVAERIQGGAG